MKMLISVGAYSIGRVHGSNDLNVIELYASNMINLLLDSCCILSCVLEILIKLCSPLDLSSCPKESMCSNFMMLELYKLS